MNSRTRKARHSELIGFYLKQPHVRAKASPGNCPGLDFGQYMQIAAHNDVLAMTINHEIIGGELPS